MFIYNNRINSTNLTKEAIEAVFHHKHIPVISTGESGYLVKKFHFTSLLFVMAVLLFAFSITPRLSRANISGGTVWDLVQDFSDSINPNGAWSFGWEQTVGGELGLYNNTWPIGIGSGWYDSNHGFSCCGGYTPAIWKNRNLYGINGVQPSEVSLHPGPEGSLSIVRWTSPIDGQVNISGYFGAGNPGAMSYYIVKNDTLRASWLNDPGNESFNYTENIAKGDTWDFLVGINTGYGYSYGDTPLHLTITTAAQTNDTSTPVSWWRGEENANDAMGLNNGALENGVQFASGKIGQAFLLNGVDQYILIGDPIPPSLQIENEITLEACIYVTSYPTSGDELGLIVGSQMDATESGATIFIDGRMDSDGQQSPIGHIHFQIGDGSWHGTNANAQVPLNQWVHIVATRKAGEDGRIYYNGVLQPSTSIPWLGTISYDKTWFAIGFQKDLYRPFNGLIDEVKIYNRALSSQEVLAEYKKVFNLNLGSTLLTSSNDEFIIEQGAQRTTSIPLANLSEAPHSATIEVVNPYSNLGISIPQSNPISVDPEKTDDIPITLDASTTPLGMYNGILLKIMGDDGSTEYTNITVYVVTPNTPQLPDLSISAKDISATANADDSIALIANIHNLGTAPAANVVVEFYDFDVLVATTTINQVAANGDSTATITLPKPIAGDHIIRVVIDPIGAIQELNKGNNEASKIITIGSSGPTTGGILIRGNLPSAVCPGSLFTISGQAVYNIKINELYNTDYPVKGGTVTITASGSALYGDMYTDSNGNFSRPLLAPTSPGFYPVTMSVTDTTLIDTSNFVFQVLATSACYQQSGQNQEPIPVCTLPACLPTDGGLAPWSYVLNTNTGLWQLTCSMSSCPPIPTEDVFVYSENIAFLPNHPDPNTNVIIGAQIQYEASSSALASGQVEVDMYVAEPGASKTQIGQQVIDSIPAGGSRSVFANWQVPAAGIYIVEVDAKPLQLQENLLDNAATRAIIVGPYTSEHGVLSGQVHDTTGGVSGILLKVSDASGTIASTVTDDKGFYLIQNVPVGDYQVTAGTETKTASVVDQSVTNVDFVLIQSADITPPVITPTVSGKLGSNGWYGSNVTVSWSVVDDESTVTSKSGCNDASVTTDTAGTTFTCSATSGGGSTSQSVIVKRDATLPTITAAATTLPDGNNGWYRSNVVIHFTCSDTISGIANCPMDETLGAEGVSVSSTAQTVTDQAGNTSMPSNTLIVSIDKTPPIITASASPAANTNGWNNSIVTVSFICNDVTSGIANCPATQTLGEAKNQSMSGTTIDNAGNSASTSITGINIDLTPPVVRITGVTDGATYTLATVPTIGCMTTDTLSGVQNNATLSVTGGNENGLGTFIASCTGAIDKAGNAGMTVSATYQVTDLVEPINTGALSIGFWRNKNGQAFITSGASSNGTCNSGIWLQQYTPYQDLSKTATCSQVGTYVINLINAATASGSSMNRMLKAQMLATALGVYFSDPTLGGNQIAAPAPIGDVSINLTKICNKIDSSSGTVSCSGIYQDVSGAFGGAAHLTILQMLAYTAGQSNSGGSLWYGNIKASQELAKNAFDAINNRAVFAP